MTKIFQLIYRVNIIIIGLFILIFQSSCSSSSDANVSLTSIAINPSNSMTHIGINQQFVATGIYSNGLKKDITNLVTWSSSNPTIMPISNIASDKGFAMALLATTTPVIITANLNGMSASTNIIISSANIQSLVISATNLLLHLGITQQLTAIGVYADGTQDITQYVSWSTSNSQIAIVNSFGKVIPISSGAVIISASIPSSLLKNKKTSLKNLKTVSTIANLAVSSSPVQQITVENNIPIAHVGVAMQLEAVASFADSSTQDISANVVWTSSNDSVVTIDDTGRVTPINAGNAVITSTLNTSSGAIYSNTANISVSNAQLKSVNINPISSSLYQGVSQKLTATGSFDDGNQDVTSAVNWTSSNTNVATINNTATIMNGTIYPSPFVTQSGTTNITASVSNGSSTVTSVVATLTVSAATLRAITINSVSPNIPKGMSQQYTASGTFSDGSTRDITNSVIWTSGNSALINISNSFGYNGLAKTNLLLTGSTTINATLNGISSSTEVNITAAVLNAINISPSNTQIGIGASIQFNATGSFSDGSTVNLTPSVFWSSSNTNIVNISNSTNNNGLATGLGLGSATIVATFNGFSVSTNITVGTSTLQLILINPGAPIVNGVGGTQQLTATGVYSDGTQQSITESVIWGISDTSVATITSGGIVTGIGAGTAMISAQFGTITTNVTLAVNPYLYVINDTSTNVPTVCTLNSVTGLVTSCLSAGGTGFLNAWAIDISGGYAYITNTSTNNISACSIAGGSIFTCNPTGSILSTPRGIVINNGYAYIANSGNNTVTICQVNGSTLYNCNTSGSGFNLPYGITVNNGYVYVTNYIAAGTVSYCNINLGILSSCNTTGTLLNLPTAITINNGYAYITNGSTTNTVVVCVVNANGSFSSCVDSGVGATFNNPFGVKVYNGAAYVVNANAGGSVFRCTINTFNGLFTGCVNTTASGFFTPTGLIFY